MKIPCQECISFAMCITKKKKDELFGNFLLTLMGCSILSEYLNEVDRTYGINNFTEQERQTYDIAKIFNYDPSLVIRSVRD